MERIDESLTAVGGIERLPEGTVSLEEPQLHLLRPGIDCVRVHHRSEEGGEACDGGRVAAGAIVQLCGERKRRSFG